MQTFTTDQIAQAVDSPTYNPPADDADKAIYNMMSGEDSQDVIDYYTAMITNLPTANVYSGVLQNPRKCDIESINNSMNDLNDNLNNAYQDNSSDPTWQQAMDTSNPDSMINQLNDTTNPNSVQSAVNTFSDHTDRMTSNFPSILGMIQAALGVAAAIGALANPCLGIGNFLNSLLEEGKQILATIEQYIKDVLNVIAMGIGAVMMAVQKLLAYAQEAIQFIEKEIAALVAAIISALKFGMSSFLKALSLDPCASALLGAVTTAGAGYIVGTMT